jgi:hypothetical protein
MVTLHEDQCHELDVVKMLKQKVRALTTPYYHCICVSFIVRIMIITLAYSFLDTQDILASAALHTAERTWSARRRQRNEALSMSSLGRSVRSIRVGDHHASI